MQVARWGNSLAVRLPAELVKRLGLKEGDELVLHPREGSTDQAREVEVERKLTKDELLEQIGKIHGYFPADYKFKREDAYPPHRGGSESDETE